MGFLRVTGLRAVVLRTVFLRLAVFFAAGRRAVVLARGLRAVLVFLFAIALAAIIRLLLRFNIREVRMSGRE
jgi:hypothetical protein